MDRRCGLWLCGLALLFAACSEREDGSYRASLHAKDEAPMEPPVPTDPCQRTATSVGAAAAVGPFATFEELCERWGKGACERLRSVTGADAGTLRQAVLLKAGDADAPKLGLAMQATAGWYVYEDVARTEEVLLEHGFRVLAAGEGAPLLLFEATAERRYEFSPGGPAQVLTRKYRLLCGSGRRERAGCFMVPLMFRRETRRGSEPPTDVATTELTQRVCPNGRVVYEGDPERLSGDNAEHVKALIGVTELRFP